MGRRRRLELPAVALAAAALLLTSLPPFHVAAAEPDAAARPGPPESATILLATLRAVDPGAQAIVLVTGTGHALRLVRIELDSSCAVLKDGVAAAISELEIGCFLRVERSSGGSRRLATKIETIRPAPMDAGR